MVPVRHERWPESALLRPSPWARRGGTVCPSCWYQGDAVPRRGTAGGAERLCTHALVAEQVPCQRVRGIRACGTPLAHHESTEARRGDEAHHAKSALPICGHLQQGGCQAREETTNVTDGAPHPGMAPGGAGARARAVWPAPDRAPCLQGGHGAHRGARWPPRSCQPVGTRATLWRRKEPSMHEDARQLTTASGRGSVANHRKQESLDSQVIDFLRENFLIWLPKANFATEPPTLTNRVPQIFPLSSP
jgi:hypothetical protein